MSKTLFRENGIKMNKKMDKKWKVLVLCLGLVLFTAYTVKYWEVSGWQPLFVLVAVFLLVWTLSAIDFNNNSGVRIFLTLLSTSVSLSLLIRFSRELVALFTPPYTIPIRISASALIVATMALALIFDE